jgi:hypothetical protein
VFALVAFAAVGVLLMSVPAYADTSQSTGHAIDVTLLSIPTVDTGVYTAANDGTTETHTGNTAPSVGLLGSLGGVATAGALVQQARAFTDGTSAACAGAVGQGGLVQIGNDGTCTVTGAPSGGVSLLSGAIKADAVLEWCTADSSGNATAHAQIVNLQLANGTPINISLPNVNIPGIANLAISPATVAGSGGQVTATALHLDALSVLGTATGTSVNIGKVTCGVNAATSPIPSFPMEGLPIVGGIAVLAGGVLYVRKRRQRVAPVAS